MVSCEVAARQLHLSFAPWGACEADCGDGFNSRAAMCANEDGIAADISACSGYSGGKLFLVQIRIGSTG
jgi:hypothetical protein